MFFNNIGENDMRLKTNVFLISLITAFFSQSVFAVYHQAVSVATDKGEPVQSATVSLSIPGQDTVTVKDNSKEDDDDRIGFFKIPVADSAVGKKGTLTVTRGGSVTTQAVVVGKTIEVSIASASAPPRSRSGGEYTVDISRTDGNTDTSLAAPFYNGGGDHLELTQTSFGIDYRMPLGSNPNMFWGAQGRLFIGNGAEGLNLDLHPTAGRDTFLRYQEHFAAMLYAGMILATMNEYNLSLILGARATQGKVSGMSDESGGGGIRNHFSDVERSIQPSLIMEVTGPKCEVLSSRWRAGVALDRNNDHSVNGVSTLGFDYHFDMEDEWQVRTFFGVIF